MKLSGVLGTIRAVILGPPGCGKGTVSERIVKDFDFKCISSGDIFRSHIAEKTDTGKMIQGYIGSGKLIPDDMVTHMILDELSKITHENFLLDGFPRNVSQAEEVQKNYPLNVALKLSVPFDIIIQRVKYRRVHLDSGRGIDDITGEPLVQREDDKPDTVLRRLREYQRETQPLQDFYEQLGILHTFAGSYTNRIWPFVHTCLSEYQKPLQRTVYS